MHKYKTSLRVAAFLARDHQLLISGEWVAAFVDRYDCGLRPRDRGIVRAGRGYCRRRCRSRGRGRPRSVRAGPWQRTSGAERAKPTWRLADLLLVHAGGLAGLETFDNGKPMHDTLAVDLPAASEMLRYHAGWATKLNGISAQIEVYTEVRSAAIVHECAGDWLALKG